MSQQAVLHRWFEEVWNNGRESAVDELMAPDAAVHGMTGPDGAPIQGPTAFKAFYRQYRAAFTDIRISIEDTLCQDDRVMVRCRVTARHTGDGVAGPASGKTVEFSGICLARIGNGRILEGWNQFDFLSMFQQVGLQLS